MWWKYLSITRGDEHWWERKTSAANVPMSPICVADLWSTVCVAAGGKITRFLFYFNWDRKQGLAGCHIAATAHPILFVLLCSGSHNKSSIFLCLWVSGLDHVVVPNTFLVSSLSWTWFCITHLPKVFEMTHSSFAVLQDDNIGCLVAGAAWHKQIWKLRSCSAQSALALSALLSSAISLFLPNNTRSAAQQLKTTLICLEIFETIS